MKASKFLRLKSLWGKQPEPIVEFVQEEVKQEPIIEKKPVPTKTSKKKLDEQPTE